MVESQFKIENIMEANEKQTSFDPQNYEKVPEIDVKTTASYLNYLENQFEKEDRQNPFAF